MNFLALHSPHVAAPSTAALGQTCAPHIAARLLSVSVSAGGAGCRVRLVARGWGCTAKRAETGRSCGSVAQARRGAVASTARLNGNSTRLFSSSSSAFNFTAAGESRDTSVSELSSLGIPVFQSIFEYRTHHRQWRRDGVEKIGFVPTMGALHDGHLSLVRMAASSPLSCERIVVSIFVNPAQFAPHEDLASYPRTLPRDLELLRSLTYRSLSLTPPPGFTPDSPVVHAVIAPTVSELYPSGISTDVQEQRGAFVEVVGLSHQLEGTVRPHFFRGVATVVTKLLNAAQADVAIFGQKDAQQCCVVRRMVRDLLIPTRIVVGATSRERDGLAMSSRNAYLSPAERAVAPVLHRALAAAKDKFESGEQSAAEVVRAAREVLDAEAARTASTVGLTVQYVSLSDPETLEDLVTVAPESEGGKGGLLSAAVGIGKTRLIDNELLGFKF